MAQTQEAVFYQGNQLRLDYTPSADVAAGEIVHLGNNLVGVVTSPEGIKNGQLGSVAADGIFKVKKASGAGVTFARGAKVSWDDTNNTAVANGSASESFKLGVAVEAAADGDDHVKVWINHAQLA